MEKRNARLTYSLIVIVSLLTVAPVIMLIIGSFSNSLHSFGNFTLKKYVAVYTDPMLIDILGNTATFVLGSALFATVLAIFLAYLNNRTDIPFKFLFKVVSVMPMMIPHVLFGVSWALLLNPTNGILNMLLMRLFTLSKAPFNIYTIPGMIVVEGLLDLPVAYLIISPAMGSFDATLEESSRVFKAGPLKTFFRITLPVLRPAIMASFILCIVRALASFAVPSVLGMPGRIYVLSTFIYRVVSMSLIADYGKAAAIGMSILVISISLIYVYRYYTRASDKFVTVSSRGFKPTVVELRKGRIPLFIIVLFISALLILLPVLVLFYTSLIPYVMEPGIKAFKAMSWDNWRIVIKDPISVRSLKNSLFLGVVGATVGSFLSVLVAYVIVKAKTKAAGFLESISFLSFSFPGIVIGIGFMWYFVRTPLYGTIWALFFGYIATYLPYGIRPMTSAFIQIHGSLEESSLVCGASFATTLRRIILPLLVPGMVSAWILLATMFFRELSISVVLSRPGTETLAVQILRFSEDGQWGKLSALGLIMIFVSTAMVLVVNALGAYFKPGEVREKKSVWTKGKAKLKAAV
ncbi:MAG TPA: iron ABC transporter permease [Sphaerochaeta sp.]|nr:iron ABC transporter permease [Sphaerochaeta sp.]HQB55006.1 iron ABC transporter permease [Sphaerochaeta sp.]